MKFAIKINSKHIEPKSNEKLSPKELFLFAQMKSRVSYFGNLDTTIEMLSCFVKFKSRKSDNKKEIKTLLSSLVQKGVIVVEDQGDFLRITLPHIEGNYDLIPMEILEKSSSPHEFMLLVYIYRFDHMNGECLLSYSRIMELLEVSRGKAFEIVEDLTMRGLIFKHVGGRIEEKRQEMNKYKVTFVKEPKEVEFVETAAVSDSSVPSQIPHETKNPQEPQTAPETVSELPEKEQKEKELPQVHEETPQTIEEIIEQIEKEVMDTFHMSEWDQEIENRKKELFGLTPKEETKEEKTFSHERLVF